MRIPRTKMGFADIVFFALGVVSVFGIATWTVKLDNTLLPTAVNGISSVTGIMIGLTSVLIVFSMNQCEGKFVKQYREHMTNSMIGLMASAVALIFAYSQLVQYGPEPAVKLASVGLIFAFIVFFEYLMFLDVRIVSSL